MHFVLTESFGLILYEILLWNYCTMFWNAISFNNSLFGRFMYNMCEFLNKRLLNIDIV